MSSNIGANNGMQLVYQSAGFEEQPVTHNT
jgi:hypothetical protein